MLKSMISAAFLLCASAAVMAAEAPTAHFKQACEKGLAPASVSLKPIAFDVLPVSQKSLAEIATDVASEKNLASKASLSYTQVKSQAITTNTGNVLHDAKNDIYCGSYASEVSVGYEPVKVVIADVYKPGSCQFKAVKSRESRHLDIFYDSISERNLASLSAQLNAGMPQHVFYGKTEADVKTQQEAYLAKNISNYFDGVYAKLKAFDKNSDEYALTSACGAQVGKAVSMN